MPLAVSSAATAAVAAADVGLPAARSRPAIREGACQSGGGLGFVRFRVEPPVFGDRALPIAIVLDHAPSHKSADRSCRPWATS